jgi:hypothetical protein
MLTAEEAIAAFEAVNAEFQLPADSTAQLGFYTAAVGDGTYRYQDRLAWGISWHECAVAIGGDIGPPPTPDLSACTAWLFLDANTGEMLEAAWQHDA